MAEAPRVEGIAVDDRGIHFAATVDDVVDVCFDGRRIWSFWLLRDSVVEGSGRRAEWPSALTGFLNGATRLSLVAHVAGVTLYDEEVRLGRALLDEHSARIAIVNAEGKPLGLDKSNRLSQTFDTRDAAQVAPLLDSIEEVLAAIKEAGIEAFPAYGTLLGAVRGGKLIGHDSDADLGYVSRHTHPVDVVRESLELQRRIAALGYSTHRYSGIAFKIDVIEGDGAKRGLDVFGGFIKPAPQDGQSDGEPDMLYLMGEIGAPFQREWIFPLGTTTLEGRTLPAPAEPERLLEATYGLGWRVPDPAYHFSTPRTTVRRLDGWFRGHRTGRDEWERRWSKKRRALPKGAPSELARLVMRTEGLPAQLIDLGAGRAGDSLWFARQGTAVTALDFVPWASEAVQAVAEEEGLDLEVRLLNLNSLRSWLATGSRFAHTPGPRAILCRHLADDVTARAREATWRFADMALREGGRLYLETREDHLAADVIAAELAERGAVIVHRDGTDETTRWVIQWQR